MNNIIFKACLYLDPRFKNTLSAKDQSEVNAYLTALYDRIFASRSSNFLEEGILNL